MRILAILARVLFGLTFVVFGSNYFYGFLQIPTPDSDTPAAQFLGVLAQTKYLTVVKVLEIVGGALVLLGLFVPLGLTILTPIVVNIVLYHIFMLPTEPSSLVLTTTLMTLNSLLIVAYWPSFKGLLAPLPRD